MGGDTNPHPKPLRTDGDESLTETAEVAATAVPLGLCPPVSHPSGRQASPTGHPHSPQALPLGPPAVADPHLGDDLDHRRLAGRAVRNRSGLLPGLVSGPPPARQDAAGIPEGPQSRPLTPLPGPRRGRASPDPGPVRRAV